MFKHAFSDVEEARPLLRSILPPGICDEIEWSTLRVEPGSSVDESLAGLHSDVLFSAEAGGHPTLLFLLVEHQSSVEPLMAYRVLRYVTRVWDRWLREHPTAQRKRSVPRFPAPGIDGAIGS